MKILKSSEQINLAELQSMSEKMFGNLVKAVVDIQNNQLALDMNMHVDGEQALLHSGSKQADLWGINLHPELSGDDFVEFDSMINLRPNQGNRSRGIDDENIKKQVLDLVDKIIAK